MVTTGAIETLVGIQSNAGAKSVSGRAKPGIGSSIGAWKHTYGQHHGGHGAESVCSAKTSSCFGPLIHNSDSGKDYQFVNVYVGDGVVDNNQEQFVNHTNLGEVESQIARTLPKDARFGSVVVDRIGGSCGWISVTVPSLTKLLQNPAHADPTGIISITVSYINSNFESVYSPSNVQTAQVSTIPNDPTQSC
jgi:hypothetical protein